MSLAYRFGPFELRPDQGVLLRDGELVALTPKAVGTLAALVERHDQVVRREELLSAVWSESFVEEGSLSQNISVLRKLLADDYPGRSPIETIARVGYRFREPVTVSSSDALEASSDPPPQHLAPTPDKPLLPLAPYPSSRRLPARIAVSLLLLAGAAFIARSTWQKAAHAQEKKPLRIAVLTFTNLSQNADNAWFSGAFRETLATDLTADAGLRMIPAETVERAEHDLQLGRTDQLSRETLHRLSSNLDCDDVITGSYLVVGDQLRLDTHLVDAHDGTLIGSYTTTRPATELLAIIDRTGSLMQKTMGASSSADKGRQMLEASVSSNPDAYRLYVEGIERAHNYDGRGALELLQQSIALDPKFALSHVGLASAYTALGERDKASAEAHLAESLDSSLPREQQLRIHATVQMADRNYADAAETYRSLVQFFPDKLDYSRMMAANLNYAGHPQQGADIIRSILTKPDPEAHDPVVYSDLADCYSGVGDWASSLDWSSKGAAEAQRRSAQTMYERLLTTESQALFHLNRLPEALTLTQHALEIARRFGDVSGELRALNRLGQVQTGLGDFPAAQASLEEALAEEQRVDDPWRSVHTLSALGSLLDREHQSKRAMQFFVQELQQAKASGQPDVMVTAELDIAQEKMQMGERKSSDADLHRILDEANRIGDQEAISRAQAMMKEPGL